MMTRVAALARGSLARFLVAALALYGVLAYATDAPVMILVLNGLALSCAAGVCVVYASAFGAALVARPPTRGDFLGAGVWMVSAGVLGMRVTSYIARDLAMPEVYNSDLFTGVLYVAVLGALLHLWAPVAIDGRVPRPRWIGTALVVAAGCLLAVVFTLTHRHVGDAPPLRLR